MKKELILVLIIVIVAISLLIVETKECFALEKELKTYAANKGESVDSLIDKLSKEETEEQ